MTDTKTESGTQRAGTARGDQSSAATQGRTSIADNVVAKIAGMAAREVGGVYKMGGGAARALGAVRDRLPGTGGTGVNQGVSVEVGERQAAVDIDLVVEYGVAIPDLAAGVRRNVIAAVERMTGLEVAEVNVTVDDIHLPGDDSESDDDARSSRVQ
ncbi:Asp23/Gls24 family envelope stress response protein [Allonocardiopsis opalescens]|uniref:Putative alkaline shock family protein YloU n=1 Tax=Allonocardiopsis opalescens TaxID=1144618 RepID=A0A2T0PWK4_9ACTN|nr:Asp23/Gls24 family envelope stress response protein [Allonocardiopsis opalescens]PRX95748.1 putative alkaline shock family protein YloU [Allonocardiopsis opalescens]